MSIPDVCTIQDVKVASFVLLLINDGNLTERDSQEFTALLQQSKNTESHLLYS